MCYESRKCHERRMTHFAGLLKITSHFIELGNADDGR